jgi:FAD/FMN-containing dehydrogenase
VLFPNGSLAYNSNEDKEQFKYQRTKKFESFLLDVSKFLRNDQIDVEETSCRARGKPWNSYHKIACYPKAILMPESTEEVSMIMKCCYQYDIKVIPFGGGTSLEGQTLSAEEGN